MRCDSAFHPSAVVEYTGKNPVCPLCQSFAQIRDQHETILDLQAERRGNLRRGPAKATTNLGNLILAAARGR